MIHLSMIPKEQKRSEQNLFNRYFMRPHLNFCPQGDDLQDKCFQKKVSRLSPWWPPQSVREGAWGKTGKTHTQLTIRKGHHCQNHNLKFLFGVFLFMVKISQQKSFKLYSSLKRTLWRNFSSNLQLGVGVGGVSLICIVCTIF